MEFNCTYEGSHGKIPFRVDGSQFILEYGTIEQYIDHGSYCSSPEVTWCIEYSRPEYDFFKCREFDTLEKAFDYYYKCDLNMKGV